MVFEPNARFDDCFDGFTAVYKIYKEFQVLLMDSTVHLLLGRRTHRPILPEVRDFAAPARENEPCRVAFFSHARRLKPTKSRFASISIYVAIGCEWIYCW